jgi:hypothetical protein
MTDEEIIADERYHTCSRCQHEHEPFSVCHLCKWGEDTRPDLWKLKEEDTCQEEPKEDQ